MGGKVQGIVQVHDPYLSQFLLLSAWTLLGVKTPVLIVPVAA